MHHPGYVTDNKEKRMIEKNLKLAIMGTALVLLVGCSSVKVSQVVEVPARQSGMVNAKKLAVVNISGDNKGTFTAQVESYLGNINVRGAPYFEMVERQMLDKIIAEQRMVTSSGYFNEKDVVKLGKLSAADTLIMGSVSMPPVSVRNYTKKLEHCKDKKCTQTEVSYEPCVEKNANIDFTLKAVSVQQGNIIFTQTYSGKADNTFCGNGDGKGDSSICAIQTAIPILSNNTACGNKNETELRNQAINQVLDNLRKDVAPYPVVLNVEFMEQDDSMSSDTEDKLEGAMEYVKQQRVSRACEIFKDALASDTNSPALYYNLGVCAEIGGDLDRAETLYSQSDRKAAKPIRLISAAINRVKAMKSNQATVSQQMH